MPEVGIASKMKSKYLEDAKAATQLQNGAKSPRPSVARLASRDSALHRDTQSISENVPSESGADVRSGVSSSPPLERRRQTSSGIAKQMQMALMQDAESRQKNIKKTPIDFPHEAAKGGQLKAKRTFEMGGAGPTVGMDEANEEEQGDVYSSNGVTVEANGDY